MKRRRERAQEAIRHEVSDILKGVKDPRIGFVSVVSVEVSSDLSHARIFVSILGDEEQRRQSLRGLESARGYIRRQLGQRLRFRHAPDIAFINDTSIEHGTRISQILGELGSRDRPAPGDEEPGGGPAGPDADDGQERE